jgi:hypothetical protein
MRDEEALVFFCGLVFAALCVWMTMRHKVRTERLKIVQKALDSGNLDEATRRQLLEAVASDAQVGMAIWRAVTANAGKVARGLLFVSGWLTFTISGCCLAAMLMFGGSRYDIEGASIALSIGFGLVTLPLALRELEARRPARG